MGKELIEAYAGGTGVRVEDFRRFDDGHGGTRSAAQDKGHGGLLRAFVAAVIGGGAPPVPESALLRNSAATLAVVESLRTGEPVELGAGFD